MRPYVEHDRARLYQYGTRGCSRPGGATAKRLLARSVSSDNSETHHQIISKLTGVGTTIGSGENSSGVRMRMR